MPSPRPLGGEGWVRGSSPVPSTAFPAIEGIQPSLFLLYVGFWVPAFAGKSGGEGLGASMPHHISRHIFAAFAAKAETQTPSGETKETYCNPTRSGEINYPAPLSALMTVCRHAAFGLRVLKPITYSIQSRASPIWCSSAGKSLMHKNLIAGDAAAPTSALT